MKGGISISVQFSKVSDPVLGNDFIHHPMLTARSEGDVAIVLLSHLAICDESSYRGI